MARKVFTWGGKKVSRTTYFRMKRKGLPAVDLDGPVSAALPPDATKKAGGDYDLVRDFLVMVPDEIDTKGPVLVPPRTFKAIIRILRSMGY